MSNRATTWALEQRHLKPATWIVLIKLGDRHNKDTLLVFPEQSLLASDCNMGRSTLNRHLSELEADGLIYRVQRMNPATKKQLGTYYILQPDFANPPDIDHAVEDYRAALASGQTQNTDEGRVSNWDTGAVSQKTPIPCPNNDDSRVPNRDTLNLVREPKVNPSAPASARVLGFDDFWEVFPKPRAETSCRDLFAKAIASGVSAETIVEAAELYALEFRGGKQRYAVGSNDWLFGKGWERFGEAAAASGGAPAEKLDKAAFFSNLISAGRFVSSSAVSPALAREMLGRRLVTKDQLRSAGIAA